MGLYKDIRTILGGGDNTSPEKIQREILWDFVGRKFVLSETRWREDPFEVFVRLIKYDPLGITLMRELVFLGSPALYDEVRVRLYDGGPGCKSVESCIRENDKARLMYCKDSSFILVVGKSVESAHVLDIGIWQI